MLGRTNTGGGGGGGGLNFQVIGSTKRPDKPTENMVWVNTDVDITGYVLSATEPENPTQGMVWIKISDLSALKIGTAVDKDYITIMLDSVYQYHDDALNAKEYLCFQDGVWKPFSEAYATIMAYDAAFTEIENALGVTT